MAILVPFSASLTMVVALFLFKYFWAGSLPKIIVIGICILGGIIIYGGIVFIFNRELLNEAWILFPRKKPA